MNPPVKLRKSPASTPNNPLADHQPKQGRAAVNYLDPTHPLENPVNYWLLLEPIRRILDHAQPHAEPDEIT